MSRFLERCFLWKRSQQDRPTALRSAWGVSSRLLAQVHTIETSEATLRIDGNSCDLIGIRWKSPALDVMIDDRTWDENGRSYTRTDREL